MFRRVCLILTLAYVSCEVAKKINDIPDDKGSMLGLEMIHKNIDKDTIINRNFKLEKKSRGKIAQSVSQSQHHSKKLENHAENREADWSYSPIPQEVSAHVEQFKRNMTECLKEVQANDKRPVKRLSPKQESPVYGECLIACVLKRNGVIDDGKVHRDNLLSLVRKFYSKETKLMKKLEKHVDRCIELSGAGRHDDCALAARLNACTNDLMQGNKHKLTVNY